MAKEAESTELAITLCRAFGIDAKDYNELHLHIVAGQPPILELGKPAEVEDAACLKELKRFQLISVEEEPNG